MEIKPAMVAIAAFVVITVIAAVLMPILDDATTTQDTYTNEGLWRMEEFANDMKWEYSSGTWYFNDVEQISGSTITSNTGSSAVLGTNWSIRANGWIRGETITGNSTNPITIVANDTVTVQDGNSTPITVDNSGYGVKNDGNYVMTAYNQSCYVLGDSTIYATGQSSVGTGRCVVHLEGSINDGITGHVYAIKNDSYTDLTISNIVVDYEEVAGHKDLYKLNKVTADISMLDGDSNTISGSVTYSSYVVPYEVTAERSIHLTDSENTILLVIPALLIIAILIGILAVAFRMRE